MKTCYVCKLQKPISDFPRNKAKRDGLAKECRPCKKFIQNRWYSEHKSSHISKVRNRTVRASRLNRERIVLYLESHPCVDCGETDPVVLEFDHVRGLKSGNISRMMSDCSWNVLEQEIAKCDVRCANCHRRRTARERGWYRSRQIKDTNMGE